MSSQSNLLLLTKKLRRSPKGGRELLCALNCKVLQELYGEKFHVYELAQKRSGLFHAFKNILWGHIDGLNDETLKSVLSAINKERINKVFVDGSNLGSAVKLIKQHYPMIEVTTFFHNVESRFFWGALVTNKSLRALGIMVANYLAERKAVRDSDKIICLSHRDSCVLKKIYGREATYISPMALEDKYLPEIAVRHISIGGAAGKFALFVGGMFYANQDGISWFVREVAPKIDIPIYIVGCGFESLRSELEIPGKVVVVGEVDSLVEWYCRAQFVLAPIFDGSGMKTKVAEALMYGKRVVGTPEAFSGYEEIATQVGWICETADDFVAGIGLAVNSISKQFDPELRELYLSKYSFVAAQGRFKSMLS